jgi:hypothetical protein
MTFSYDPALVSHTIAAVGRLESSLRRYSPFMAERLADWIRSLAGSMNPEQYFLHPQAFPAILFPWWLEDSLGCEPDEAFTGDLVYSTVSGYYFIRMIDNAMDEGGEKKGSSLLPILGFLHSEFQSSYFRYFPQGHRFWNSFSRLWIISAEASTRDANITDIDRELFERVASKKVIAGRIPMTAFLMKHRIDDIPEGWSRLYDLLSYFSQMSNDLSDCCRDLQAGRTTYLLSEGERCRTRLEGYTEPPVYWILREGWAWAVHELHSWMEEMKQIASSFHYPPLQEYLQMRETRLQEKYSNGVEALQTLHRLFGHIHDE